jgi:NTE family protein
VAIIMATEATYKPQERKKGTAIESKKQRALIFQGGGALGAYEAGAYRVLYDWISKHIEKKDENLFDVIAGTSIGAINGAIILSHFLEKKNADINKSLNANEYWKGSADKLEKFWKEVQTKSFFTDWLDLNFWPWDLFHNTIGAMKKSWTGVLDTAEESIPDVKSNLFIKEWFDLLHFATESWDIPASAEAARRYWTTRTFGAPNVAAAIPRWDLKYWDSSHGFRFRGEQRRLPFWWFNPTFSLKESCQNYIKFPIKTDQEKYEPRFLLVSVDVQSGDTVSFDSYDNKTEYNEYDQWIDHGHNKLSEEQSHIISYPNGIEWDHLSTTFSMPDLYRHATLKDEKSGMKRTFWDGGVLSNTPLRELIDQHKKYWKNKIKDEQLWDGIMEENVGKKIKIPALDVYIIDVWPSKLLDDPVPSDNDFVASRQTDLILLDKTEYEESVSRMITQYMRITEELLKSLNEIDKSNKIKEILDTPIIDNTLNRKGIKKYRDLLKGNFDINRVMRIERKDDLYTMGYSMADFSAQSMNQLLELGKRDALDNLIHSLYHTIENLDELTDERTKNILSKHLEKAKESLQNKESDYYQEVTNHLYTFIDEVNKMESDNKLTQQNANLLRP